MGRTIDCCTHCGTDITDDDGGFCSECRYEDMTDAEKQMADTEWPLTLGLSIRRFLLRAEVEGLRGDALLMLDDIRRGFRTAAHFGVVERALDRLAALALEDHGDG